MADTAVLLVHALPAGSGTSPGVGASAAGEHGGLTRDDAGRPRPVAVVARRVPLRKRALDVALAGSGLLAVSPVLAVAAFAVRVSSRGPVLFRQVRIGRGGRPFTMLKLRTMRVDNDDSAQRDFNTRELTDPDFVPPTGDGSYKERSDPRTTAVGRVLRRYSIDELPQLFNVLRGDMSIVGPRPSLAWEVELYPEWSRARAAVPPGITGRWQVNGRNRLSMRQMLALDRQYVDTWTLRTDLACLLKTPAAIVKGDGAG